MYEANHIQTNIYIKDVSDIQWENFEEHFVVFTSNSQLKAQHHG